MIIIKVILAICFTGVYMAIINKISGISNEEGVISLLMLLALIDASGFLAYKTVWFLW
jgi:hypothetical protein